MSQNETSGVSSNAKSQIKKAPVSQNSDNQMKLIIGGALIVVLSILLYLFVFTGSRREIVVSESFPYIFNASFRNELNTFVTLARHKDVLVVYGPPGIGKTRGIKVFEEYLNSRDVLTFDFDFKTLSEYASTDDFIQYLQSEITKSLQAADNRGVRSQDLVEPVKLVEALTSIERPIKMYKQVCKDPLLQRIAAGLFCITDSIKTSHDIAINALFEAFDALAPLQPVVFVHDVTMLQHSQNQIIRETVQTFWRICESFSNDYRSLPIIIEMSDEREIFKHSTKETIHLYRVGEFDADYAKSILVKDEIFSQSDFQFAMDKFGGHGRSFAQFYDKHREGMSPQNIYRILYKQCKDRVVTSLNLDANKTEIKERFSFLRQISSKHLVPVDNNFHLISHFMEWKVLSLWNMTHCSFPDKLTEKVVFDVLSKVKP